MRIVAVALWVLWVVLAGIGSAVAGDDARTCMRASGDRAIEACTQAIRSGRYSGRKLASFYNSRAVEYGRKGDYDTAIADASEVIRLDPKNKAAYHNRGTAYRYKGDYDRAIADYSEAIKLDPDYEAAYINRGRAYRGKGNYERAIAEFTQALKLDPNDQVARKELAGVRALATKAKPPVTATVQSPPASATAEVASDDANACRTASGDRAIEVCTRAIRSGRESGKKLARFYNSRSIAFGRGGDYDSAIADASEAIRLDPGYLAAYANRALASSLKHDYDRAIADYTQAIHIDPKNSGSYYGRANAYRYKRDYDRAIADYNEGIRIDPKNKKAYNNRGVVYMRMGDYDRAIADYNESIRIDPNAELPYNNRGVAYRYKGDYDRAIADASKAIDLNPKYESAYRNRASAYRRKGDNDRAIADFAQAVKLDANDRYARKALAELRAQVTKGKPQTKPNLQEAVATQPAPPSKIGATKAHKALANPKGRRVALVIGNAQYKHVTPLINPANDARLIAETLHGLGFTLVGGGAQLDLDKPHFDRVVQDFGNAAQGADVALFYYAGHGVRVGGANYLVPVGANPVKQSDVDFQMLDSNLVLRQMEDSGSRLKLMILDACRNNPFGGRALRSAAGGLAQMQAPEGTLISFATQPGNVARDGFNGHSPYTRALAEVLRKPGLDIFRTFNAVGLAVSQATGGAQRPWVSISPIKGDFYFAGK